MLKSQWPKHKRLIVFTSYGDSDQPQDQIKDYFAKGTDVTLTLH